MYGLEGISNNNGWVISGAGILIVFACLAALSLAVSRIKTMFILFDRSNRFYKKIKSRRSKKKIPEAGNAAFYELLNNELEEQFQLFELIKILDKNNFPHPYLTVNRLRYEKTIIPSGDGFFQFKRNEV
jgi:hypothetical protein